MSDNLINEVFRLENARRIKQGQAAIDLDRDNLFPFFRARAEDRELVLNLPTSKPLEYTNRQWELDFIKRGLTALKPLIEPVPTTECPNTLLDKMRELPTVIYGCKCPCHGVEFNIN